MAKPKIPVRWQKGAQVFTRRTYSMYKHMAERVHPVPLPFSLAELRERFARNIGVHHEGCSPSICSYCGEFLKPKTFSLDHRIPVSRGGDLDLENIDAICDPCNRAKGDMTADEFASLLGILHTFPPHIKNDVLGRLKAGAAIKRLRFVRRVA